MGHGHGAQVEVTYTVVRGRLVIHRQYNTIPAKKSGYMYQLQNAERPGKGPTTVS